MIQVTVKDARSLVSPASPVAFARIQRDTLFMRFNQGDMVYRKLSDELAEAIDPNDKEPRFCNQYYFMQGCVPRPDLRLTLVLENAAG